jgi:hypothetical protein
MPERYVSETRFVWISWRFLQDFHAIAAGKPPTILYTACAPRYKITLLFTIFSRSLIVSYEQAMDHLSRDDRFKATVYAMNTLLIHKGIYTHEEFEQLFVEWALKQQRKLSKAIRKANEASA